MAKKSLWCTIMLELIFYVLVCIYYFNYFLGGGDEKMIDHQFATIVITGLLALINRPYIVNK